RPRSEARSVRLNFRRRKMASSVSLGCTITLIVDIPKEALETDLSVTATRWACPPAAFVPVVALLAVVSTAFCALAVCPEPAGARGASGELRKLSQAKVAQAAISTQRYLKGLSPAFCRATLKLTAIDYTERLTIMQIGKCGTVPEG